MIWGNEFGIHKRENRFGIVANVVVRETCRVDERRDKFIYSKLMEGKTDSESTKGEGGNIFGIHERTSGKSAGLCRRAVSTRRP